MVSLCHDVLKIAGRGCWFRNHWCWRSRGGAVEQVDELITRCRRSE